jgi:hypothetical protein
MSLYWVVGGLGFCYANSLGYRALDMSSVLVEDTVIEQAGFVSRRSESNKVVRAGSSRRRFESQVLHRGTWRIPGLELL